MGNRSATVYVDYQQRASEFAAGDMAFPLGTSSDEVIGRVVAVYPAIGMVDIEFPHGSGRYPVEEVEKATSSVGTPPSPEYSSIPGGNGSVSVPGGPTATNRTAALDRLTHAFVKKALYWAAKNRHYKATKAELDSGSYTCPKCKEGVLQNAPYERMDGSSVKLLGCRSCLFLVKPCDIIGDPSYIDDDAEAVSVEEVV